MDNNYRSIAEEFGYDVRDEAIGDVNSWNRYDDMLKFSNCWNATVNNCVIIGGKEDAIDMCRGGNYGIFNSSLFVMGKNGITAKCGIDGLRIEGIEFLGRGNYCEIELGMFSKYDKYPFHSSRVENVIISNVRRENGKRVWIWVWNSERPEVRGKAIVIVVPRLVWLPYFLLRQWMVKHYG
jgi:hypothetical protein